MRQYFTTSVYVSGCLLNSVCLDVVNTLNPEQLEISSRNFRGIILGPRVRRETKFENGSIGVSGWWFNVSEVLLCEAPPGK